MSFMDAREAGSKPGSGGAASQQNEVRDKCFALRPLSSRGSVSPVKPAVLSLVSTAGY